MVSDVAWVRPKVRVEHALHAGARQAVLVESGGSLGYNAGLKFDESDMQVQISPAKKEQ